MIRKIRKIIIDTLYYTGYIKERNRGENKMEEKKGIRYFPIALFASVMGVSGVAISTRLLETTFNYNHILSTIITLLAVLFFIINGIILIFRLIRYPEDVKEDYEHPVKMNFFAAVSISLLLLAVLFYEYNETLSLVVWAFGAVLQVGLTLHILAKLIWIHSFQLEQFNPAWIIPIVGNIVAPLAGVHHVEPIVNWIFFSIGILFSIIYFTLLTNRIFFRPPVPDKLLPTFYILLAPPGIGFVSYIKLTGTVDAFAYVLFGIAFYIGLLFVFQLKRFLTIPFFISWWAYLFPSAAVTSATLYLYIETGYVLLRVLTIVQVIGLYALMIYLLIKSVNLLRTGALLVKEV